MRFSRLLPVSRLTIRKSNLAFGYFSDMISIDLRPSSGDTGAGETGVSMVTSSTLFDDFSSLSRRAMRRVYFSVIAGYCSSIETPWTKSCMMMSPVRTFRTSSCPYVSFLPAHFRSSRFIQSLKSLQIVRQRKIGGGVPTQSQGKDASCSPACRSVWEQLHAKPRGTTRSYVFGIGDIIPFQPLSVGKYGIIHAWQQARSNTSGSSSTGTTP